MLRLLKFFGAGSTQGLYVKMVDWIFKKFSLNFYLICIYVIISFVLLYFIYSDSISDLMTIYWFHDRYRLLFLFFQVVHVLSIPPNSVKNSVLTRSRNLPFNYSQQILERNKTRDYWLLSTLWPVISEHNAHFAACDLSN